MIYSDLVRQILLGGVGGVFLTFAVWAIVNPTSLAKILGYELITKNAINEFHAIYVGVFVAQFVLCIFAIFRVQDAAIGNMVALFLLAQPLARLIAIFRGSAPSGILKFLFMLEVLGGLILLVVQPSA
jgi:hypothetical protein